MALPPPDRQPLPKPELAMSARPKLPEAARSTIMETVEKRRALMREIARLQDEKRALPNNKTLAKQLGVSYDVVHRTLHGDPYKERHPQDERARAA
jgi:hypothetical protein